MSSGVARRERVTVHVLSARLPPAVRRLGLVRGGTRRRRSRAGGDADRRPAGLLARHSGTLRVLAQLSRGAGGRRAARHAGVASRSGGSSRRRRRRTLADRLGRPHPREARTGRKLRRSPRLPVERAARRPPCELDTHAPQLNQLHVDNGTTPFAGDDRCSRRSARTATGSAKREHPSRSRRRRP